MNYCTEI